MTRMDARINVGVGKLLALARVHRPPVPVERLPQLVGAALRYEPFEGQLSGVLLRKDGVAIIGVNALHPKTRQRFTIAHELGHLILNLPDRVHVDRDFGVQFRDERSSQAIDRHEIAANAFAAHLLMPTQFLEADLRDQRLDLEDDERLRRLADRYRVSLQSLTIRLGRLGYRLLPA